MNKEELLAQNLFQRLTQEIAQNAGLQVDLQIKDAEISELSRQIAVSGEIIAHVKEVCAENKALMEFIEAKLK